MANYFFNQLLFNEGWAENVTIQINSSGTIVHIEQDSTFNEGIKLGCGLPGFQNAHSHSFQYAMAGLAEVHNIEHTSDNFWSWREAMYRLALSIDPDQLEAIATMLYAEMLRHGYTNVAEFHYVHHDKDGQKYENLAEMSERLIAAASSTGINITIVPIFYQKGGFGKEPNEGQRRFISNNSEEYLKLFEAVKKSCNMYEGANCGVGIHSMRAVEPELIKEIAENGPQNVPFHIHVSEQLKEIEDSIEHLGKRPVEWLLDNIELNHRFNLVHATHLTSRETERLAHSGANVVICPTTEGNLGDGIFPLNKYIDLGGKWSIGTDSHVGINPLEELRLLDYGQRLISHQRNTFAKKDGDSGKFAIEECLLAGKKAMGNTSNEFFKIGNKLNVTTYKSDSALLAETNIKNLASSILYSTDSSHQEGTISNGELVCNSQHINYHSIKDKFLKTIATLNNR